jgi:hypothetical protein
MMIRVILIFLIVMAILGMFGRWRRPRVPPKPRRPAVEPARKCPACGSYIVGESGPCGSPDCPSGGAR